MKQTEANTFQTYINSRQRYEKHPDAFTGGAYMLSMQLLLDELAEDERTQMRESQINWGKRKTDWQNFFEARFSTRRKASEALAQMKDLEKTYGYITLADYYDCCDIDKKHYIDDDYGWTDLSDAVISLSKENDGSYMISLKPIRNIKKEIEELKNER